MLHMHYICSIALEYHISNLLHLWIAIAETVKISQITCILTFSPSTYKQQQRPLGILSVSNKQLGT